MTIVQVKDATGSVLDWMVAKCEGTPSVRMFENSKGFRVYKNESMKMQGINFAPSTVWAQGGPIIDREKIDLFTEKGTPESWVASMARYQNGERLVGWRIHMYGPTPLIAVMRCYVASKLGEVVKVPQELL